VLRAGRVQQVGSPEEIYGQPASRYVAGFMGYRNELACGAVAAADGEVTLRGEGFSLTGSPRGGAAAGPVVATIRPEDIVVGDAGANRMEAVVEVVEYHGREQAVQARLAGGQAVHFRTDKRLAPHDAVVLSVPADRVLVFPADSPAAPDEAA
jgi:putative spermidine/putrescine transport system ATP-binding protein